MALKFPNKILQIEDGFVSYLSSPTPAVTGNNTLYDIICDQTYDNTGSNYDTTTGIYTASATGFRIISGAVTFYDSGSNPEMTYDIILNGSNYSSIIKRGVTVANQQTTIFTFSKVLWMNSGETLGLQVRMSGAGSDNVQIYAQTPKSGAGGYSLATYFSGSFLPHV